jgi:hypothetical protein
VDVHSAYTLSIVFTLNDPAVGPGGYAKETEDPAGGAAIANTDNDMSATALAPRYHPIFRLDIMKRASTDGTVLEKKS